MLGQIKNILIINKLKHQSITKPINKKFILIAGTARAGTSLLTKAIDVHPNVTILMENIFGNRRRYGYKNKAWQSSKKLKHFVCKTYSKLKEPVLGNKIGTPDVWSAEDINMFCHLFKSFNIVFIFRDPHAVLMSRFKRENYQKEYNDVAKKELLLNFQSKSLTYISSWRQNIENYRRLKDANPGKVHLIYYEDLCKNPEKELRSLCKKIKLKFDKKMLNWHKYPHHDKNGNLKKDLKYPDKPFFQKTIDKKKIPQEIQEAIKTIPVYYKMFKERHLNNF